MSVPVRLGLSLALGILAILLLVGLAPAASSPLAQTGTQASINLDTTFGTGGVVSTSIGTYWDVARAVAIQEDGKIVAAGYTYNGSDEDFALVRYTVTGTLDTSFGAGGVVSISTGSNWDIAHAVAIQEDGKIVAAGYTYNGGDNDFILARYTVTGTLDTAFGTGGIVSTSIGSSYDGARAVAIQGDGKIVAAGFTYNGSDEDFAVVRYTTSGALDTTFGTGGVVTTPIGSGYDGVHAVAIQEDGKIVAAGYTQSSSDDDFALVRYTVTGTLDTSFDAGGVVTTPVGSSDDSARGVAIQEDGKIVAAGSAYGADGENFALVRYTVAGTLDTTFGTGGIVITPIGTSEDGANDVAIQDDGKIVAVGAAESDSGDAFAVARYTTSGALDHTFHPGGVAITPIGPAFATARGVAIQEDGKIVAVGETYSGGSYNFAVARYRTGIGSIYLPQILRNP